MLRSIGIVSFGRSWGLSLVVVILLLSVHLPHSYCGSEVMQQTVDEVQAMVDHTKQQYLVDNNWSINTVTFKHSLGVGTNVELVDE